MNKEKFSKFQNLLENVKGTNKFSRLGRTFETKDFKYYYDTGTGKVFQISENLHLIIESLIKTDSFDGIFNLNLSDSEVISSLEELHDAVVAENIMSAPQVTELYGEMVDNLQELLKKQRTQIMLELTETCNLNCKYCIYHKGNGGFREFGTEFMTFDIAKRAIDQLMNDSTEEVFVSFYGGEPLLCFDLIKQCVDYCRENYPHRNIRYTLTTNATLITEEIANYLSSLQNSVITVSLDGPKEVTDKYRVFSNGEGSFDKAITGLKLLVDAYGDRANESIIINSVIAEYTESTLAEIQNFFDELHWLPKDRMHSSSYVDKGKEHATYNGVDSEREKFLRKAYIDSKMYFDPIGDWASKKIIDSGGDIFQFEDIARDGLIKELKSIHSRFLVNKPHGVYGMNGCCVPGARKIYVAANGDYLVCEKMGPSPRIGDVYSGLDFEKIKMFYVDKFREEAVKYCKNCWAINLCGLCYTECYDENDVNLSYRHIRCENHRIYKERLLIFYHQVLEKYPEKLEFLNEYTIV